MTPDADNRYTTWIKAYADERNGLLLGKCREACVAMAKAFPELTAVPGHVLVMHWGQRSHWWLTTPDGEIVDPTASQFPLVIEYQPWTPVSDVQVGRCYQCGAALYAKVQSLGEDAASRDFCDAACTAKALAFLNGTH